MYSVIHIEFKKIIIHIYKQLIMLNTNSHKTTYVLFFQYKFLYLFSKSENLLLLYILFLI